MTIERDRRGQTYLFAGSIPLKLQPEKNGTPELAGKIKVVDASLGIAKGVPGTYEDLKGKHHLAIKLSEYRDEPGQLAFVDGFFGHTANEILEAPTGSGKTYVALAAAAKTFGAGKRVLFLAPSIFIVAQSLKTAQKVIDLPPTEMISVTGNEAPEDRVRKHYSKELPKLICATPEVIRNDVKKGLLNLKDFALVIFDEVHWARGEAAYVDLAKAINAIEVDRPRILCCSATVAAKNEKLQELSALFATNRVARIGGSKLAKVHTIVQLENFPTHKQAMDYLDQAGHAVAAEIGQIIPQNFEAEFASLLVRQDGAELKRCLPPRRELLDLITRVRDLRDKQPRGDELRERATDTGTRLLHMLEIVRLRELVGSYGTFMFLDTVVDRFCELWADRHGLAFPNRKKSPRPEFRLQCMRSMYREQGLRRAFDTLAAGTEYADFYKNLGVAATWEGLLAKANLAMPADKNPLKAWPIYRAALKESLVKNPKFDHVKEERLILDLIKRRQREETGGVMIFDDYREHATFLASRINYLTNARGEPIEAGYLLGGNRTNAQRERAFQTTDAIKHGQLEVLVATSAAEEGIHIPAIVTAYSYAPTTQGIRVTQRIGRVGREDPGFGEMIHFIAKDTGEMIAYFAGRSSQKRASHILDQLVS